MIVLTCGHCRQRLAVPERWRGQAGPCPACQGELRIALDQQSEPMPTSRRKQLALAAAFALAMPTVILLGLIAFWPAAAPPEVAVTAPPIQTFRSEPTPEPPEPPADMLPEATVLTRTAEAPLQPPPLGLYSAEDLGDTPVLAAADPGQAARH